MNTDRNNPTTSVEVRTIPVKVQKMTGNMKWWQYLLLYPTLLISLIGAIPKYTDWVNAFRWGIPAHAVESAREQVQLWEKNYDCSSKANLESIATHNGLNVGALVCPSGDVLIKVHSPVEKTPDYRWIGLTTFTQTTSLFGPETAYALANAIDHGMTIDRSERVLCQKRTSRSKIIRIIKDSNGNCWKEKVNTRNGRVVDRDSVSCDFSCS